ncbi:MAG: HAMP domain-containing protein [Chloroflexi bacterium]|nr:HAMP domain-containing protein [Chloroflexota bacterium]
MSIRLRLTLWFVAVLAVVLAASAGFAYAVVSRQLSEQFDRAAELRTVQTAQALLAEARSWPWRSVPSLLVPATAAPADLTQYVEIVSQRGEILATSSNLTAPLPVSTDALRIVLQGQEVRDQIALPGGERLGLYGAPLLLDGDVVGGIFVGASLQPAQATLERLRWVLVAAVLGVTAVAAGLAWLLVSAALRPVDRITRAAHEIGASADLSRRLPEPRQRDELGRLTTTFNEMLGRLDEAFAAQQRFLADVSHELRTPVTTIRANAEMLLRERQHEGAGSLRSGADDRRNGPQERCIGVLGQREAVGAAAGGTPLAPDTCGSERAAHGIGADGVHRAAVSDYAASADSASADSASADSASADGASADSASADSASVDSASVDGASVDSASVDGASVDGAAEKAAIGSIVREAGRMGRLVNDLLALARADAGQPFHRSRLMLDTVLVEVFMQQRPLADGVRLMVGDLEQIAVDGDRDRLKQLLLNLVDNALRHTLAGGTVTLDLVRRADLAELRVRDTGSGIGPEHLPRIFDRFYRVDGDARRAGGGAGLGLAICRQIAEAHGGRIDVESRVGVGTTFTLRLPAVPDPPVPIG